MTQDMSITIDTSQHFNVMNEYMAYTKRSNTDATNIHTKYVAGRWFSLIPVADKDKIESSLMTSSETNSSAPIAAILVNKQRAAKGLKGLNGSEMKSAVAKFIRIRQSHRNYLRSGAALAYKFMKLFAPSGNRPEIGISDVKVTGLINGGAIPARGNNWNPIASIWSKVKVSNERSVKAIENAAQMAVNAETENMKNYIIKKQWELLK